MEITSEEYRLLFQTISDMIKKLDALKNDLVFAQQRAEEIVISRESTDA